MDVGTVLSAVQTLFASPQCSALKKLFSSFLDYHSQLEELNDTVKSITSVLRDADEAKQELSQQDQNLIEELTGVIFEADDLLDEVVTFARQKVFKANRGKLSKKMSQFFSSQNKLRIAHRARVLKKKLDGIAYNKQFCLQIDLDPIRKRSRDSTFSYIDGAEIIGREHDLKNILGKLLAPTESASDVSFLSIVGIGGLGKTALAQLVYNDPRVTNEFALKLWTCVSDEGHKNLDVKDILAKILASSTQNNPDPDEVQSQLQEQLAGKKYLLVLDDVWTENREDWYVLEKYLQGGERGSRILVTTRSIKTASSHQL